MHYIIFDLEATCWDKSILDQPVPNETIEIGALKVNASGEVLSEFSQFIKPIMHPTLSEFCTKLTTITQADVESAACFNDVIANFQRWIDIEAQDYLLCSWGFYDRKQLESDCAIHHISAAWVSRHISIKHQYGKIKNLKRDVGMKTALGMEKIELAGTHHRGIDDARNISAIFMKYIDKWNFDYSTDI